MEREEHRNYGRCLDENGGRRKKPVTKLLAKIYENSSDCRPMFNVPMGSYYPKTIGEMEELGRYPLPVHYCNRWHSMH